MEAELAEGGKTNPTSKVMAESQEEEHEEEGGRE